MGFTGNSRGWLWFTFSEPLNRADISGLTAFVFGLMGWTFGTDGFLSHFCALCAGMALGLLLRDRQQRAYDRCKARQQSDHNALMAEISAMDFEALIRLCKAKPGDAEFRRCPKCGRATYNRGDIKQGYCGACHERT